MAPAHISITLRALAVAAIAFAGNLASTQFAWQTDTNRVDHQLSQIGEIYLDGLTASIKAGVERGAPGEVDQRLRAAFSEQGGIAERLLLVVNGAGAITNIAGKKALAADSVITHQPGAHVIDRDTRLMTVSRRIGQNGTKVTAVLDVEPFLENQRVPGQLALLVALACALAAGLATAVLSALAKPARGAATAHPAAPNPLAPPAA
jgi:two-component system, OmpR family, sensor kinase